MNHSIYNFIVLMIVDSFGIGESYEGNAFNGNASFVSNLISNYPSAVIKSSIELSSLTKDSYKQMATGCDLSSGQELFISERKKGAEKTNPFFMKMVDNVKKNDSKLHLVGLVSNSSAESSKEHLYQMIEYFSERKVPTYLHLILDGENDPEDMGGVILAEIATVIKDDKFVEIASVCGRYYAMDKGYNWERSMKYFEALVDGRGRTSLDLIADVKENYEKSIFDNEIKPINLIKRNKPVALIEEGDGVLFVNSKPGGIRQIARLLTVPGQDNVSGWHYVKNLLVASISNLGDFYPVMYLESKDETESIGSVLGQNNKRMLYVSDVQKAAYFDCLRDGGASSNTEHIINDSDDLGKFGKAVVKAIKDHQYNLLIVSNSWLDRAVKKDDAREIAVAVSDMDTMIKKVVREVEKKRGLLILTSTYGRAEKLIDMNTGDRIFNKSNNNLPFLVVSSGLEGKNLDFPELIGNDLNLLKPIGNLSDIAPTVLDFLGLEKSPEMEGDSLVSSCT